MHVQLRHKKVVDGAIIVLALLVFALSMLWSGNSYRSYQSDALAAQNSKLADLLADAMEHYTLERGLTVATLGAQGKPADAFRAQIVAARRQADDNWQQAMALARTLENGSDFDQAVSLAVAERARLDRMRARVELYLDGRGSPPAHGEWIDTVSQFVTVSGRVWETALFSERMTHTEVGRLAMPRKILWEVAEQAGRERALLAYYLGAGRPVPDSVLNQLQFLREMTAFGIERARRLLDTPSADPRIKAVVAAMQRAYIEEFAPMRTRAYRAARAGDRSLDMAEWIEQAGIAIRSIHVVNETITTLMTEMAEESKERHLGWFGFALFLLVGSVGLSVMSLTRVRRLVEGVFEQKELAEVTMDSIGDAVITTDVQARVEYLNPVAEGLTGWTNTEAKGKPL